MKGLAIMEHHDIGTGGGNNGESEMVGENIGSAHLGVKGENLREKGT